jgi:hypothetical protein
MEEMNAAPQTLMVAAVVCAILALIGLAGLVH